LQQEALGNFLKQKLAGLTRKCYPISVIGGKLTQAVKDVEQATLVG
jgi:hypothetical protein